VFSLKYFNGETVQDIALTGITGEVFELEFELANMAGVVRGEALRCATGEDGRWAVAMCLKAQESVNKGAIVKL
jgi:myo-inositol 2-dehydrogenase/D-chiro-inositol 1-dehydrogenase